MQTTIIDILMIAGGIFAACAIAAMCGIGLVVWLAGGRPPAV